MRITATVEAYVKIDVDLLIAEIMKDYGYSDKSEISTEDIYEYISDHIPYIKGVGCESIEEIEGGHSISRIDFETLRKIKNYIIKE